MENKIVENIESKKLRGGYYTPRTITDFICKWAITKPTQRVLEPSCGDGNFIESAIQRFLALGVKKQSLFGLIKGIELNKEEAEKSKQKASKYGLNSTTIEQSDFFNYLDRVNGSETFDIVLGNPPFIRYQNFPEEHRDMAFRLMQNMGLQPNKLTNIWVPFLVLSAQSLKTDGKLGMVIPAELFQVKYAAETRIFLAKYFSKIVIITFKKLVFDDIQQEVVILLCDRTTSDKSSIQVVELNELDELETFDFSVLGKREVKELEHNSEKWIKYFLSKPEICLLRKIKTDPNLAKCGDHMQVDVGIVTGRNEFFMMNEDSVKKWKLKRYTRPVVTRSSHFKGLRFNNEDLLNNSDQQLATHLFLPPNKDFEELPKACQEYIRFGEENNYHIGYKCRIRKRWYITPSLWAPDAFALRQVGDYPKIIVNRTDASSTDTIHRIKLKSIVSADILALSFLNSLSFAFSEILGRSYGGGVLTFEPSEIEEIPLPILDSAIGISRIEKLIRNRDIDKILDIMDEQLLIKQLGYSFEDVTMLRCIWKKLADRRNNRKRKA